MVSRIIRHELRRLGRDGVVTVSLSVFAVATTVAVANGHLWAQRQAAIIADVAREESLRFAHVVRRLEDIEHKRYTPTDPYEDPSRPSIAGGWMAHRFATMPPSPLMALATGHTDLRPAYAGATIWNTNWPTWLNRRVLVGDTEIDNALNLVVGRFDLAFVIVYLLPLVVIGLTYGLLADEREEGTLALVVSQPLDMSTLVAAKLLARAAVVGLALAVLAMVGLVVMPHGDAIAYRRFGSWLLVVVSYTGLWFAIGAWASTCRGTSAVNATRLAATWVALVVVLPATLNAVTGWLYPLPERAAMVQQAREAQLTAERQNSALTERFYDEHPEFVPASAAPDVRRYSPNTVYAQFEEVNRTLAPVLSTFETQRDAQARMIDRLSVISPVSATVAALVDAAGAGPERDRHFRRQVEEFRVAWRAYFVPRMFRLERITAADVDDFPRFQFVEEAGVEQRTLRRSFGLLVPAAVLLVWARARMRRVTVLD